MQPGTFEYLEYPLHHYSTPCNPRSPLVPLQALRCFFRSDPADERTGFGPPGRSSAQRHRAIALPRHLEGVCNVHEGGGLFDGKKWFLSEEHRLAFPTFGLTMKGGTCLP